jgi:hypothetical protein
LEKATTITRKKLIEVALPLELRVWGRQRANQ